MFNLTLIFQAQHPSEYHDAFFLADLQKNGLYWTVKI